MRYRARVDDNQGEIVKTLLQLGFTVHDSSRAGGGFTDLVVGAFGLTVLVEVKDGAKSASKRKLTEAQQVFHAEFTGAKVVVKDLDDCLALQKRMREVSQRIGTGNPFDLTIPLKQEVRHAVIR